MSYCKTSVGTHAFRFSALMTLCLFCHAGNEFATARSLIFPVCVKNFSGKYCGKWFLSRGKTWDCTLIVFIEGE